MVRLRRGLGDYKGVKTPWWINRLDEAADAVGRFEV